MKKIFFINFLVIVIIFLFFEVTLRFFNIIELQGFEKNSFFKEDNITYHKPNILKIGMGKKIKTDDNGFRIPLENFEYNSNIDSILILGDSVSFGVSVEEKNTFIGILRKELEKNFYNSSVAGHRLENYPILLKKYHKKFPEIKEVLIFLCINDIVASDGIIEQEKITSDEFKENKFSRYLNKDFFIKLNFILREKSALFNLLKAIGTQNVKRHFYYMYPYYNKKAYLEEYEKNLKKIIQYSNFNQLNLKFVLLPYKYQIKKYCEPEFMNPQNQINAIFKKLNYQLFDFSQDFCDKNNNNKLFLNFDPMHLSPNGHKFVSQLLLKKGMLR